MTVAQDTFIPGIGSVSVSVALETGVNYYIDLTVDPVGFECESGGVNYILNSSVSIERPSSSITKNYLDLKKSYMAKLGGGL